MSLVKSPTLTPRKLAANRANALKSTGPRTARGKAHITLNSLKHGGRCSAQHFRERLVANHEDAALYDWILRRLVPDPEYRDAEGMRLARRVWCFFREAARYYREWWRPGGVEWSEQSSSSALWCSVRVAKRLRGRAFSLRPKVKRAEGRMLYKSRYVIPGQGVGVRVTFWVRPKRRSEPPPRPGLWQRLIHWVDSRAKPRSDIESVHRSRTAHKF